MKKIFFAVTFLLTSVAWSATKITLDEITAKVKSQNLIVLQNAEKVYQAKLSIDEARLNLLPRLNLWNLGKVLIEPAALLDIVQDIAPFLVPSNWFRLKETELLYKAEQEGYRALQANEIYAARSLYLKVLMDQEMFDSLKSHQADLQIIKNLAEDRLDLGLERPEVVREIQIQYLKISEDVTQMSLLMRFEISTLNQALGLPVGGDLTLMPVTIKSSETYPIDPKNWEAAVLVNSPELRQYSYFLRVIPQIKKEIYFSFLGVPTLSRGTAGGIFDGVPTSQGLGFATGKKVAIVNSQAKVFELQKKGVEETLKRQILNVSQIHNAALSLYPSQKKRLTLSQLNFDSLKEKILLGQEISLPEVSATILSLSQARAAYSEVTYKLVMNYDMLKRLSFLGPYSGSSRLMVER